MLFVLDSKAALLACFLVLFAAKSYAAPSPCSGGFDNLSNNTSRLNCPHHHGHHHHQICGTCPEGMQREVVQSPYCGTCLIIPINCDDGHFKNEMGHCETCPCLKPHEERRCLFSY
ncbi:hypothetical protein Ocin01_08988 [Orchesella cincta]|uniref:Uncharacterized protein n=1 Tax=Orchesella cincta TaxID=48709 RepID=A0A1D2MXD1_ORCCI|nr:hypothetical protein Ocin01_08988 [Orchesella cincta]